MTLRALIGSDMVANHICDEEPRGAGLFLKHLLWGFLFKPNFMCVVAYRVNRWMFLKNIPGYDLLNARRQMWFCNDIHYQAEIGPGFHLVHFADVHITPCTIGKNVSILNGVTIGKKMWEKATITIGDNVYIGTGTKILGSLSIGDRVTVGALSFVNCNVPSDSIVYGIPPNRTIQTGGVKKKT